MEKGEYFLALDLGTETVKAAILKKEGQKPIILGVGLEYYEQFGVWDGKDLEKDILKKTISKAVEKAQEQAKIKPKSVLLGLPADIFKARIIFEECNRVVGERSPKKIIEAKEKKEIQQKILAQAKKNIAENFCRDSGILPQDLEFLNLAILEIKIDGYLVPEISGYDGENLEFRILATFIPKYYLENFRKAINNLGFKIVKIIHSAQNLSSVLGRERPTGMFLDIGGEITQIFLMKNRKLEKIEEFKNGGKAFSEVLSQTLGLSEKRARILKERYSRGLISKESRPRFKEIFSSPLQEWFENLKAKLRITKGLIPSDIFIFGGGSLFPEIEEVLSEEGWGELPWAGEPRVKFIRFLNNPQNTTLFLLCYGN